MIKLSKFECKFVSWIARLSVSFVVVTTSQVHLTTDKPT